MTEHLLEPPVNVIRLSLHPEGLARRIVNLDQWREHLVHRLRRERDIGADPRIEEILREIGEGDDPGWLEQSTPPPDLLVPLLLRSGDEVLSLVSATTVFGPRGRSPSRSSRSRPSTQPMTSPARCCSVAIPGSRDRHPGP